MSFAGATKNYAAAYQTNDTRIAFALEDQFGVSPGGAYQSTRFTGESFRQQFQRNRPEEINDIPEASQAVTTQMSVAGSLSAALSFGTYDDLLAGVLGADWTDDAIVNGGMVKCWTVIERLGDSWFVRNGGFIRQAQLSFSQGGFAQASFDMAFKGEKRQGASPAASLIAAPTGDVIDTVKGFGGLLIGGVKPDGCVNDFKVSLQRNGADIDYGMGHADGCGIRPGELLATGSLEIFFRNYELYDRFVNGQQGPITASVRDGLGEGYDLTFLNASLQNPQISVGGKNRSVMAAFDIEGNPQPGGGTFSIKRFRRGS
ncbi:phage tail tube protein [Asaia krungthepensis]|uniref:Phage minor tail protein n=1 Tax=Asaia krungthepensis NRIC 0535 TaxID=1307925 RepID=A0ABQ0Q394_9PROT|nr:phage tail tube protein [Asaia krungthepensis]GBQ89267.1 phage minor tail protein [Asaia krungthepensis NRIC 0535]